MLEAILNYNFMQNALFAALLSSVVCGLIGTIIIEKRLVMMSGGIAHSSFGGIGLGYFLGFEPIIGALIFSGVASVAVATIKRKTNTNTDTFIGILWSIGMALGIIFIAITPGYPPEITSYLFGDILTVSNTDILMMLILVTIVTFSIFSFFNYWKAYLFDETFSFVIGLKTAVMEYLMFLLIGLTVVVLIKVVGLILVIALLTAPPAIARLFTYNLKKMMALSVLLGALFGFFGLLLSYEFNIASGATIILLAGASYFVSIFIKSTLEKRKKKISFSQVNNQFKN
ncbi:MAG: zinc transport system permease protein [Kosmotogales bacterium]|nr:zinc transport system permease protein [Kosmotogales bacterium]